MMGANHKGQLGVGKVEPLSIGSPTLVESLRHLTIFSVSCGLDTTTCIAMASEDDQEVRRNSVWAWGANKHGQLGLAATRSVFSP